MQVIYNSGIFLATGFLASMHFSEFVLASTTHFDEKSKLLKDADAKVIIHLNPNLFEYFFKHPDVKDNATISP